MHRRKTTINDHEILTMALAGYEAARSTIAGKILEIEARLQRRRRIPIQIVQVDSGFAPTIDAEVAVHTPASRLKLKKLKRRMRRV